MDLCTCVLDTCFYVQFVGLRTLQKCPIAHIVGMYTGSVWDLPLNGWLFRVGNWPIPVILLFPVHVFMPDDSLFKQSVFRASL